MPHTSNALITTFQMTVVAIDPGQPRYYRGVCQPSEKAGPALNAAVDAAQTVLAEHGFKVANTGYGVIADLVEVTA